MELMHLVKLFQIISIQCVGQDKTHLSWTQGCVQHLQTIINVTSKPKSLLQFKTLNSTQFFTSSNEHNIMCFVFQEMCTPTEKSVIIDESVQ